MMYVGYDRYFDFHDLFMAIPHFSCEDEAKLKRELREHVPFVAGYRKKPWFKEDDLAVYLTERFPGMPHVRERLEAFGISQTIMRYAGRDTMFKLLEDHYATLSRLYNRYRYYPEDKENIQKISQYEEELYALRQILTWEMAPIGQCRQARYDYQRELLKRYRGEAWAAKRFDGETTDLLKTKTS